VESSHPYPFALCYCSICRKTAGGGGFAINLGADNDSLEVRGREHVNVYQAAIRDADGSERLSEGQRHFCSRCGSALWVWDSRWPALLHPFASAIDTPLPIPPERVHLMLGSKADWVEPCIKDNDKSFDEYPDESLAEWHERLGLTR
jgi:hypothetical protein